ncbi:MAG: zeta toxin family protein [Christensenellaceae bacterium]|jgi:hypothetical protein|nr:zeta toxin family protein [Christensenellaceae bacterium]
MKIIIWNDNTPQPQIDAIANTAFADLTRNYTRPDDNAHAHTAAPVFVRVLGQSGAGKSTQGLPAVLSHYGHRQTPAENSRRDEKNTDSERNSGKDFIVLAIADFIKYHPCGETVREKANGFCLRVLTEVLHKLIAAELNIVLDMTVLTESYEAELLNKLTTHNYELNYFILAVPKKQSDKFIAIRKCKTGRVVSKQSAEFFNDCLQAGVELLAHKAPHANCVMWSAYELQPIYHGEIGKALTPFNAARQELKELKYNCDELLHAKTEFMKTLPAGNSTPN